ncbi:hypothetical protein LSUE1_G002872 [Lachnellula suecica]|uniref:F-box domain-containing protein n=1 Tax=Lachnellula suecica TaxID=602035 RepID=A0A8T9CBN5_9HELO|nr:hypothetical protein LSUE1_G002872 [Lachnellula suecica]
MDPLHITEFASERYFSKLKQLNQNAENAASTSQNPAPAPNVPVLPSSLQAPTFTLPLGRQRSADSEISLALRPSEQKKRSLGHDLTALRTQRRPNFTGSFGRLRSQVNVIHKSPSIVEHREEILAEDPTAAVNLTFNALFLALPNELQAQIIAPLEIHDILSLRLVSKSFHTLVTLNEAPIARYHITHSLPAYTLRLYPQPKPKDLTFHYLCGIWHRLHVATKLTTMISNQATKEIFLRTTETARREFEPQHQRMRQKLMPLVFALFHFFETYRDLHVKHINSGGIPLRHQAYTMNPIEVQVISMYDDETLLKMHQVFPLVISSFSRRLRPPSYAGRIERSFKGYLKDRPADEVYATILTVGGLRQAQRFWETKGYNIRRAAVDTWYGFVTRNPVEAPHKSKMSIISHLGRKKHAQAAVEATTAEASAHHDAASCNEWFCVKPSCFAARRRHSTDNLVFHSSLAAGPPMSPLSKETLRNILPDLPHLHNIWMHTAEALILERKIVPTAKDIKRNTQVLLELINEVGSAADPMDDWSSRNQTQTNVNTEAQDPGAISE